MRVSVLNVISADFNIDSQHIDLIRQKYTFLLEKLSTTDSGLIAMLFQKKVIDQQEKEFLESARGAVLSGKVAVSVESQMNEKVRTVFSCFGSYWARSCCQRTASFSSVL
jgi:hypothetical protein